MRNRLKRFARRNRAKMYIPLKKLVKNLRWTSIILGVTNVGVIFMGVIFFVCWHGRSCTRTQLLPFFFVMVAAGVRVMAMIRCAVEQQAAAIAVLGSGSSSSSVPDASVVAVDLSRLERRLSYKRWLWWTRFATVVTLVQLLLAMYLIFVVGSNTPSTDCALVSLSSTGGWKRLLLVVFLLMVCFVAMLQCFASSDVLRWRSFYDMQDSAWKAHYQEVFDHGIREALCCLGRVKYLKNMEEDEVNSVAQMLGDLVTYRASGTGHLEFLAGLALLQMHNQYPKLDANSVDAPEDKIEEAAAFYPFAEAAYTGKCQAAYFIVVLHDIRSVVIAVRGTETPEDLITDGLCRETFLTMEDLDGLISGLHIDPITRQAVLSSFPHYGHSGIVESARELYHHIEGAFSGASGAAAFESGGFLSSLLGAGCECDGYAVRIVGHSLGGAIAALLGIRLYGQFSDLRVYAYGPLPCVDSVIADACSGFITSIVHDSEFSSFLSVNSILRLRAAALTTFSQGSTTDKAMISKLAQLFLNVSKYESGTALTPIPAAAIAGDATQSYMTDKVYGNQSKTISEGNMDLGNYAVLHNESRINEICKSMAKDLLEDVTDSFLPDENHVDDPVSRFLEAVPSSVTRSTGDPPEIYLPGLVIHLIRRQRGISFPLWKGWGPQEREPPYKAIIANRENFKEILVSPYMFLDHLPWRCQYALQRVWESRKMKMNHDGLQSV
ncbi:uncharacterized protein LOC104893624 isoform X4 [Beta vulgaris subsp. vulgaris]|uniref:uncharacterized protein LOC104893624 isoform X4 n=1 Tax=Beta vulgaris subsp. vulgaris TaxID=3555 RepID=UPI0020376826|nr:uncharacterized protein LOC104893624 isoform X4 [Beta vulgaris subsp. vulgaris]